MKEPKYFRFQAKKGEYKFPPAWVCADDEKSARALIKEMGYKELVWIKEDKGGDNE